MIAKRNTERLKKDINEMENLLELNVLGVTNDLKKKRLELKTLLEESAKGALIRASISSIRKKWMLQQIYFSIWNVK